MGDGETGPKGHRERLRQRLLRGGADALADYELLEYLLCLAIPRQDTKPLAKKLLDHFGTRLARARAMLRSAWMAEEEQPK